MPYISDNYDKYMGQVVTTGQCVAYVQEACGAPHTSEWKRGHLVRHASWEKGTAIATFDPDGTYGNHTDGRSHAAILVTVHDDGLLVMDQWTGQPVHQRTIHYRHGEGDAVNDGDRFYVIEHAKPHAKP